MNVLSLFDGIGCGRLALDRAGVQYDKYYASEIDKHTINVMQDNYPDTIQVGDIVNLSGADFDDVDLIMGGSPCQGFSFANENQLNLDDPRSKLVLEFIRLVDEIKPKYFLLENVHMAQECQDAISSLLGVEPVVINSDRFVQQNRKRLYWTNIPISHLPKRPNWSGFFYQYRSSRMVLRESKNGTCPTLLANMGTGGHNVPLIKTGLPPNVQEQYYDKKTRLYNFDDVQYRRLTTIECERLQALPDDYTKAVSDSQRYKAIGNGWTVDVIAHIFKGIASGDCGTVEGQKSMFGSDFNLFL